MPVPSEVMADMPAPRLENAIHWRAFGIVAAIGLLMIGAALGFSIDCDWTGIWIDFFLTVGTAVLLGALGIVGSGVLVTTVEREVKRGIEETETQTAALEKRIESQGRRIDTLADEVLRDRAGRHEAEDEALAAIANDMSYEAVSSALREADLRRAISDAFRVPASGDLNGMHMHLKNLVRMDRAVGGTPFLSLTPWFADARNVQTEGWNEGEDVRQVIARLDRKIESANLTPSAVWDPSVMFTNLRDSLELANRALRGELPRRLRGPLIERLNGEWVLTEEGLESLTTDAFLSINDFPSRVAYLAAYSGGDRPEFSPPPPPGVDADTWGILVEIARVTYMAHPRGSFHRPAATRL